MMGIHDGQQPLFYCGISLDERVPAEHPLRRVKEHIDFSLFALSYRIHSRR